MGIGFWSDDWEWFISKSEFSTKDRIKIKFVWIFQNRLIDKLTMLKNDDHSTTFYEQDLEINLNIIIFSSSNTWQCYADN